MLILLPPSEGKTPPVSETKLDLGKLYAADQLTAARRSVMRELASVSIGPQATEILGLGPRSADDAALNSVLESANCAPAYELYTGVLFEAAQLGTLADEAPAVLRSHLLIFSGLWGVVSALDSLPNHRLSMGIRLPETGRMASFWAKELETVLSNAAAGQVLVDCRSADYAAAWRPNISAQGPTASLSVAVCRLRPDGSRQVISHAAKHTRGLLTGALLRAVAAGTLPTLATVEEIVEVARSLPEVAQVEIGEPDRRGVQKLTLILG